MVWIKGRLNAIHPYIYSTVRGANKYVRTNSNLIEQTNSNSVSGVYSYGTNSFTIGSGNGSSFIDINNNGTTFDYSVLY